MMIEKLSLKAQENLFAYIATVKANLQAKKENWQEKIASLPNAVMILIGTIPGVIGRIPEEITLAYRSLRQEWVQQKREDNLFKQLLSSIKEKVGPYPLDPLQQKLLNASKFMEPAKTANGRSGRTAVDYSMLFCSIPVSLFSPTIGTGLIITALGDIIRNQILNDREPQTASTGGVITSH